jgi:hypothetical protein
MRAAGQGGGFSAGDAVAPFRIQALSFVSAGDATDQRLIVAGAGLLWGVDVFTIEAAPVYVKVYDKATAPASTDTPIHRTGCPANSTATLGAGNNKTPWPGAVAFTAGLGVRIVTGIADSDNTAATAAKNLVTVYYSQ